MKYLFLLLFPVSTFSQVNGIGDIKIGMSLNELTSKMGLTLMVVNAAKENDKQLRRDKSVVARMPADYLIDKPDKNIYRIDSMESFEWSFIGGIDNKLVSDIHDCKELIFYCIPRVTIGPLEIENVSLAFKDGKLQLIEPSVATNSKFKDALVAKYPTADTSYSEKTIKCQYKLTGVESDEHIEYTERVKWHSDIAIAEYYRHVFYDSDCKYAMSTHLRIMSSSFQQFVEKLMTDKYKADLEQAERKKKEIIKGL